MSAAWVDRRTAAEERILDAAGELFAAAGAAGVDGVAMGQIATVAGCSRATLYRYFPDRPALQRAFVQREAVRVGALVAADGAVTVTDAVLSALRHVRAAPTLAAWFRAGDAGRAAGLAHDSEVIAALGLTVVADRDAAQWLVRVIVSLLTVPGGDDDAERRLVERFVVPVIALGSP
ncbi:TetR family transcriptional regulator [Pimelobacter simplex]|uniref:TetR family transcriptional regulator n=1 Tax=Nocardioides simplex TaxID=2045 RepID=UPI003AAECF3A